MGLITESILSDALLLATTVVALIFGYYHYAYKYWERRNVPFLPPKFPKGNSPGVITKSITFALETIHYYKEIKKRGLKFGGIYDVTRPVFVIVDPDYMRDILSKDFQYFVDRGMYHNEKDDPISAHLFALDDTKWKNMRAKMTPTFTSGKMKMMFQIVLDISDYLIEVIEKAALDKTDINIKEYLACFTTDVIGSCAFGIDCNSFKNPETEFRTMSSRVFQVTGLLHYIKLLFITKLPQLSLKLGFKGTRDDVSEFFYNSVQRTLKYRKENNISRPDFFQLLINLKSNSSESNPFTLDQMVANAFVFFVAGFETSSTAMTFAVYELCRNQEIQKKVMEEINEVLEQHDGKITYESLGEMKYLEQVLEETLRLYPPVSNLTRLCSKDYKLRDTDITIEKGTQILISLIGLHRDPEYYPDPEKFDPERFAAANKQSRHPYVHMPFGEGPRNCIGLRFGLMQSKIGLVTILKNFNLTISPRTKMPLRLDPQRFLLNTLETLYVRAEKI